MDYDTNIQVDPFECDLNGLTDIGIQTEIPSVNCSTVSRYYINDDLWSMGVESSSISSLMGHLDS